LGRLVPEPVDLLGSLGKCARDALCGRGVVLARGVDADAALGTAVLVLATVM